MNTLKGKLALVTGASRGIGREIALYLAGEGAEVMVHYGRNDAAAQETLHDILEEGGTAHVLRADLSDMDGVRSLAEQAIALAAGRRIDILVNNAGVVERVGLDQMQEDQFDRMFRINVKAPFFLLQQLLPHLGDNGRIINISSHLSKRPRYQTGAYAMTKAALNTLTTSIAATVGRRGITVNTVAPGTVETDINKEQLQDEVMRAAIASMSPFQRLGKVGDIAAVVAFLVTPAAGWITGQFIDVSGGADLQG